jgi:hypothetical protein
LRVLYTRKERKGVSLAGGDRSEGETGDGPLTMASRSSISSSSVHGRLSRCPAWSMVAMCMISRSGVGGRLGRVRTVGTEGGRYSEFEEREPLSAQPVSIWLKRDCQRHQASWKFECDGIGGACPARGPYIHASIIRRVPGRRTPPISQIRFCPSFNDLPKRGAATRGGRSQSYRVCARYGKMHFWNNIRGGAT